MNRRSRIDPKHLHDLERAFAALVELYRRGQWAENNRGRVSLHPKSTLPSIDLKALSPALIEILSGQRKDWAADTTEFALGLDLDGKRLRKIAGVCVRERRALERAFVIDMCEPDAGQRLASALAGATGLILDRTSWSERAAVGAALAEHGIGSGRLTMTEVPRELTGDYRNLLAGSAWVDMRIDVRNDIVASALYLALRVRSFRRDFLKTYKQGYYTACAARELANDGLSQDDISTRLQVRRPTTAPAGQPAGHQAADAKIGEASSQHTSRPASDKQITFVRDIVDLMPFLGDDLPREWEKDAKAAAAFLTMAQPVFKRWRDDLKGLRQARYVRDLIASGMTLEAICLDTRLENEAVVGLLALDLPAETTRLAGLISEATGRTVDL